MKTRTFSLPLVILATILCGNTVSAQGVVQSPLFSYLDKIPGAPVFPDDVALLKTPPEQFEEHAELNAMEKTIQGMISGYTNGIAFAENPHIKDGGTQTNTISENSVTDRNIPTKQTADSMLATLHDMQSIEAEFRENFRRLENTFNSQIDNVNNTARKLQADHPCQTDENCQREHFRLLNAGIVSATREKVKNEEYLLSVYLERVKPSFKELDTYLAAHGANLETGTKDMRNLVEGTRQGEVNLLTDIIERIKLERITISNCARLTQQYQEK